MIILREVSVTCNPSYRLQWIEARYFLEHDFLMLQKIWQFVGILPVEMDVRAQGHLL